MILIATELQRKKEKIGRSRTVYNYISNYVKIKLKLVVHEIEI